MKKILILVDSIGEKKELFAHLISQRVGDDVKIELGRFADLYFEIDDGKVNVEINDVNISTYDLIFFRRAGDKFSGIALTLATALDALNVKYIDKSWGESGHLGSKFSSLIKLANAKLPIFPTVYFWQTNLNIYKDRVIKKFGYPLIAKEISTQKGKGVHIIKSEADFDKLPLLDSQGRENKYMFQKYISIDKEYRILVLGDKIGVWEEKIQTNPDEFRHNVSQGAEELFLPLNEIPKEIANIAVTGAKTLNLQMAGVDLAIEKETHKPYLIEINRGPGLTYDTKISPEIDKIAGFLAKSV